MNPALKSFIQILTLVLALGGCGNPLAPKAQELDLVVYGVYKAPEGATGSHSPKFYEMTLTQLDLLTSSGETVTFEPDDTSDVLRIIDRPQIVLTEDVSDYEEVTFTSGTVTFGSDVVVGGKYQSDYALTLSSSVVSTTESFTIEKSKGLRMAVKIEWRNTLLRDEEAETETIEQPRLTVTTESQ